MLMSCAINARPPSLVGLVIEVIPDFLHFVADVPAIHRKSVGRKIKARYIQALPVILIVPFKVSFSPKPIYRDGVKTLMHNAVVVRGTNPQ